MSGEPHARFDEGRMKISSAYSTQSFAGNLKRSKVIEEEEQ